MHADAGSGKLRLLGFVTLVLAGGAALYAIAGPPALPAGIPSVDQVARLLNGSVLPWPTVAYLLTSLAWLVWGWIVASLVLQLAVLGLEVIARGAAWVVALRAVANRLSLPVARRAVAAAFAVQVLSRAVPAAAAPLDVTPTTTVVADLAGTAAVTSSRETAAPTMPYLVRPRDTLWSIAERAFGTGHEYRRIVEANVGRRMPDGQLFTAQGVIQPGWLLELPRPSMRVEQVDGQRVYTVEPGDTLSGIAARLLGDQQRWTELFRLNQSVARLDDGRTLSNPNLIWPGLRLRLPDELPQAPAAEQDALPTMASAATDEPRDLPTSIDPAAAPLGPVHEPDLPPTNRQAPDRAERPAPIPTAVSMSTLGPRIQVVPPTPVVDEPVEPAASPGPASNGLPTAVELAAAVGVAGTAAAFGARRIRRLRPLRQEPESEAVVEGGYAEAVLAPRLADGVHPGSQTEPAAAVAAQLLRFLSDQQLSELQVVAARHGRSATTLVLNASVVDQPRLRDAAAAFADRLGARAEVWLSNDHDVVLKLSRLRHTRLLPLAEPTQQPDLCLLPLGVLFDRQLFYGEWRALGHILVASLPGHGAETILVSLLATLTAHKRPADLQLWTIARPRHLPAPLGRLPHQRVSVDPGDEQALSQAVQQLREHVDRRLNGQGGPELVVVVSELTSLAEHAAELEVVARHGPERGIRLLAATSDPDGLHSPLLPHFGTRFVLQTADEEVSVALIGVADAAYLGGGGRLLLRLDAREPVEVYGYRVSVEHLERLVRVMRTAYGGDAEQRPPAEPSLPEQAGAGTPEAASTHTAPERAAATETHPRPRSLDALAANTSPEPFERAPAPPERAAPMPTPALTAASGAAEPSATAQPVPASPRDVDTEPSFPTTRLEVICFGGPRVLADGRQIWPSRALGDAKPWEILVFLATQPACGVAREAIANAFWPDDIDADANHRFRQLRYRLRGCLERAVPDLDGEVIQLVPGGRFRLDPSLVTSDAQRFLELVQAARTATGFEGVPLLEQARALYVADLLDAPEARRLAWLDERGHDGLTLRERYRRDLHQVTITLAELYLQLDRLDEAIALFEELTTADPGDEVLWQALFRALAERGDRDGLVREERRMRHALQEVEREAREAGRADGPRAEPSYDTVREYRRLLDALDAPEAATASV